MGFQEAIKSCLGKYATFSGRAPRSEYWFFILGYVLALIPASIVGFLLGGRTLAVVAVAIIALAIFLPSLAVGVRRLHDTNSSGWWYLLSFIPYVGSFVLLVWFCLKGTQGENRFGPDPLQDMSEVFS